MTGPSMCRMRCVQGIIETLPCLFKLDGASCAARLINLDRHKSCFKGSDNVDRQGRALRQMQEDIGRHLIISSIMIAFVTRITALHQLFTRDGGMNLKAVADEIAFSHALRADDAEAPKLVGNVEIGMKGHCRTALIFDEGGLVVDDVTIALEDSLSFQPAARLLVVFLRLKR